MLIPISIATGCLLGNVFFHLLPESDNYSLVLLGLLSFFILEKILKWHHCHDQHHHHHLTQMSYVGGSIHSLVDGALIVSQFFVSPSSGLATLLAITLHEIPQKLTYYSIFVSQKMSNLKALGLSVLTSAPMFLAAIILIIFRQNIDTSWLTPFTAGSFLYIATSDLIPELQHHSGLKQNLFQLFFICLGLYFMFFLLRFE